VSLLATGYFSDNVVTHLVAGLGAGFFAVCVGSPVDVVKSRVMGESAAAAGLWLSSSSRSSSSSSRVLGKQLQQQQAHVAECWNAQMHIGMVILTALSKYNC
jgi:hypothetical protein